MRTSIQSMQYAWNEINKHTQSTPHGDFPVRGHFVFIGSYSDCKAPLIVRWDTEYNVVIANDVRIPVMHDSAYAYNVSHAGIGACGGVAGFIIGLLKSALEANTGMDNFYYRALCKARSFRVGRTATNVVG